MYEYTGLLIGISIGAIVLYAVITALKHARLHKLVVSKLEAKSTQVSDPAELKSLHATLRPLISKWIIDSGLYPQNTLGMYTGHGLFIVVGSNSYYIVGWVWKKREVKGDTTNYLYVFHIVNNVVVKASHITTEADIDLI